MSPLPDGLSIAGEEHVEFCFVLASLLDLKWPLISRFGSLRTPAALAELLHNEVSVAFVASLEPGVLAGFIGMSTYDQTARTAYLEAAAWPTPEAEAKVSEMVPWLLDVAFREFDLQTVYLETYLEAPSVAVKSVPDGWSVDVSIPDYVSLPGASWTLQTLSRRSP